MNTFIYNDTEFSLRPHGAAWDIACRHITRGNQPGEVAALFGTGLFPGLPAPEALARARSLVQSARPVGVKTVGPDVAHPTTISGVKIVGPNVGHPQFVRWNQDSTSRPKQG